LDFAIATRIDILDELGDLISGEERADFLEQLNNVL
jgi:hypothetical protein